MKLKKMGYLALVTISSFLLFGCGSKNEEVLFESDGDDTFFESVDEQANEKIEITKEVGLDQEFEIEYKTNEPDGLGMASFKAKSVEQIDAIGDVTANEGKKLILVEMAVKGDSGNIGKPSTFNQIGDYPSPQFVLIDSGSDMSYVEETYFSDAHTIEYKLFELSKITMDHEQWVNTALVFEIDSDKIADLAFRFTNGQGETEFYDITDKQ